MIAVEVRLVPASASRHIACVERTGLYRNGIGILVAEPISAVAEMQAACKGGA